VVPRPAGIGQLDDPGRFARRLGVTPREAQVLRLVANRYSNAQIAALLNISKRTVESHMAALLQKVGAADRASLIRAVSRERADLGTHTRGGPITQDRWLATVRATAAQMRTTARRQRTDAIRQAAVVRMRTESARTRALTPRARPATGAQRPKRTEPRPPPNDSRAAGQPLT
jgi:DNA-binding CsgD family transcriptional regulator